MGRGRDKVPGTAGGNISIRKQGQKDISTSSSVPYQWRQGETLELKNTSKNFIDLCEWKL